MEDARAVMACNAGLEGGRYASGQFHTFQGIRSLLILLFLTGATLCHELSAQLPTDSLFIQNTQYRDSMDVYAIDKLGLKTQFSDTVLRNEELYFDPARLPMGAYAGLQHFGAAHYPIFYEHPYETGIRIKPFVYSAYRKDLNSGKIISNVPYTEVQYNQGLAQKEHALNIRMQRPLANSDFGFEYRRINDEIEQPLRRNLHNVLSADLEHKHRLGKVKARYHSNVFQQYHSGGIENGEDLGGRLSNIRSIITGGQSRTEEKIFSIEDSWNLRDSGRMDFQIIHNLKYRNSGYRYYDESREDEILRDYYFDERGLRIFYGNKELENGLLLKVSNPDRNKGTFSVSAGLMHRYHWLQVYDEKNTANWFALTANLNFRYREHARINISALQCVFPDSYDSKLEASALFQILNNWQLNTTLGYFKNRPVLIFRRLLINTQEVYSHDLTPTSILKFGGALSHSRLGLKAEADYQILGNYIYLSRDAQVQQASSAISLLGFRISSEYENKFLSVYGMAGFQASSSEVLSVPRYFVDFRPSLKFKFFKKMHFKTGPYFRYLSGTMPYTFQPLLGSFQNSALPPYPTSNYNVNYLLSFRINSFNFIAHAENLETLWNTPYAELAYYPEGYLRFRLGIVWKLLY